MYSEVWRQEEEVSVCLFLFYFFSGICVKMVRRLDCVTTRWLLRDGHGGARWGWAGRDRTGRGGIGQDEQKRDGRRG